MQEGELARFLMVGLGGVVGAVTRYQVTAWTTERFGPGFPYGTMFINASGSFLIGLFLTLIAERFSVHPHVRLFFAVGFLGAYTTFSTYAWDSAQLLLQGAPLKAMINVVGSVVLSLIGVAGGIAMGRQIQG
jgi:CrcB protein